MSRVNDPANFSGRVNLAALIISQGREPSRSFDNCFENNDGDAVAVALYRRVQKNPDGDLARNIWRYLSKDSVSDFAEKNAHRKNLSAWSREMVAEADKARKAWTAYVADVRANPNHADGTPRKQWHEMTEEERADIIENGIPHSKTETGDSNPKYNTELSPAGEQMVIPGCEKNHAPSTKQLDLF